MEDVCEKCKWYIISEEPEGMMPYGECHKNPPQITRNLEGVLYYDWPIVDEDDFCSGFDKG